MGSEMQSAVTKSNSVPLEAEFVKCDSCGFTEECTLAYILRIRDRYNGRWICGLCVEAVKDEVLRSDMLITTEEALNRHTNFCKRFQSSSTDTDHVHPIFTMGRILRRSLDSSSSAPSSPVRGVRSPSLLWSESCFSSLSS